MAGVVQRVARWVVPFPLRVEVTRLRHAGRRAWDRRRTARERVSESDARRFDYLLAAHQSPLRRASGVSSERLQRGKESNVRLACALIDRVMVRPLHIFSYHTLVGRPSRLRGFRVGLELHGGEASSGIGGGCCQVSNMLYWLALAGGMRIVERHRHNLDLFPDDHRTTPFGCGATVFYNYADFRFENPLSSAVLVRLRVHDGMLRGELYCEFDPGWRFEVVERDHRFFREGDQWFRENRIYRRLMAADGSVEREQLIAHNVGRVLYDPEQARCCEPS